MVNYKTKFSVASNQLQQLKYTERAKADKQIPVLCLPESAIADATTAQLVGKGKLCRVSGQSSEYITFGDASVAAPSVSTANTLQTPNDYFLIVATDDYVRTSAAMRIEVMED